MSILLIILGTFIITSFARNEVEKIFMFCVAAWIVGLFSMHTPLYWAECVMLGIGYYIYIIMPN